MLLVPIHPVNERMLAPLAHARGYFVAWSVGLLLALAVRAAEPGVMAAVPSDGGWHFQEMRRVPAAEARQGVASDGEFIYVIANHALGKYRATTGERVGGWECPEGDPLTHLNSGVVRGGRLYCAHSNYPGVPMTGSVEIWDTETMRHIGSQSLGRTDGSLTWVDEREGRWVACFVHYGHKGGEPGRGPEWSRLVEYDAEWRPTGRGWVFPVALIERLGGRGYSVSGGAFGPGGTLWVTGHDETELYGLEFPEAGAALRWVATVPMTAPGQAFGWDPRQPSRIYLISKKDRAVIVGELKSAANTGPMQAP